MDGKKSSTAVIEIIRAYTNTFGREVKPEFPFSIVRVDNAHADKLIGMGVAKLLNPEGTCIHSEMAKRRAEMKKASKLIKDVG